ncbi:MAG: HNH endonuclease signature motif containing protein [Acidiferrobacterales bacterium]
MAFPEKDVAQLLGDCKRHCCVCWRWCGSRIQLHHIVSKAQNGPDEIDNAIAVCLDCHAEIESKSNMGRHFTQAELHEHKRRWLEICREHPEVLIQAGKRSAESGPLEALLSELEYNRVLLTGDDHRHDYATLVMSQFDRAIAANALVSLEAEVQQQIFRTYKTITETADLIKARMAQSPGSGPYNTLSNDIRDRRVRLRDEIPGAISALRAALGVPD